MKTAVSLQSNSSKPMVKQIEGKLRSGILSGRLKPNHKLPSIRKLSEDMGVSVGLARLAINTLVNQGYVRSEQGRGVYVAHPWNYRQNIALVLPNLDSEQMSLILRGVKLGMESGSARMLVQAADYDFAEEADLIEGLNPSFVSGAIIYPAPMKSYVEKLRQIRRRGVPFVLVNTAFEALQAPSVTTDSFRIGWIVMEHLVSNGHRKIGVVGHTGNSITAVERMEGANEVLLEAGLSWEKLPKVNVPAESLSRDEPWVCGQAAAEKLLEKNRGITAIVGVNENITSGILKALQCRGLTPGKDISVISMNDMRMFAAQYPPITSVKQPFEEMGRLASASLNKILAGQDVSPDWVRLEPELVDRSSVLKLN